MSYIKLILKIRILLWLELFGTSISLVFCNARHGHFKMCYFAEVVTWLCGLIFYMSFFNIFAFDNDTSMLESSYHFPLILLSLLIAVFASFMAFNVASQAAVTKHKLRNHNFQTKCIIQLQKKQRKHTKTHTFSNKINDPPRYFV